MIIRPFADKPPVALNYEDIKSLAEAKDYIEQETVRREKAAEPPPQQQAPAGQPLTAQQQAAHPASRSRPEPNRRLAAGQQPSGVQQTGLQQPAAPATLP